MSDYVQGYLKNTVKAIENLNLYDFELLVDIMEDVKTLNGRLYIVGVGGNAADAMHAAADFRKLCGIQAYAVAENISEVTARTNDDGWGSTFTGFLEREHLTCTDTILILSVGGGSRTTSPNILNAVHYAVDSDCVVVGITGPDGGETHKGAKVCLRIPVRAPHVTALTHSLQSLVLHALFNHPRLTA